MKLKTKTKPIFVCELFGGIVEWEPLATLAAFVYGGLGAATYYLLLRFVR